MVAEGHQKLAFEVDFVNQRLKGWTELTIIPTDQNLRQIRLNARQSRIERCFLNGARISSSAWRYEDPYANFKTHETSTIHQHHMFRKKIDGVLHDPPEHELSITLPSKFRIEPASPLQNPFGDQFARASSTIPNARNPSSTRATPDAGAPATPAPATPAPVTARPEMYSQFVPFVLRIEFVVDSFRDGFKFVGCEPGDQRYPHAYTTSSPLPGGACCLFPTVDGIHERWTWDLEITVPRTIGDMDQTQSKDDDDTTMANEIPEKEDQEIEDEDDDLDFLVVCSAEQKDEEVLTAQPWKKVVKFEQTQPVAPQHIAFAIGPFERVNFSEFRDTENEEQMGNMTVDIVGFCLPGRDADLKNTCMFLPKACDYIVKEFGQYIFNQFKVCFVDDLAMDTIESASLALCSNQLLFPESIIDPIWDVTKKITCALTTQWAGIQVVPKDWADTWVIIGIGHWMAGCFLQNLCGKNEFRFRLKKDQEKICELDIGRPSLYTQGFQVPIDATELDFIKLKAPVVLTILEKRLWKLSSSAVLHRVVRKTFISAVAGDLNNGLMSTAHFIRLCEKNGHNKLDAFFQQWVYGAGYPRFEVSQRFNKKRMIVEMGIRQTQAINPPSKGVSPEDFIGDAMARHRGAMPGAVQPVFTGPMTIRIHEADGTPYEHVVDLKESYTKLDIPYNTKYKRLKRSRRQKERAAAGAGVDVSLDAQQNDDVLLYCLGDVLQSEEEVDDWRLTEWTKEDEERMAQESFEWIRMDADFEWICTININMPDYMFLSQLQQDRDVIAQYDSIRHFATIRESKLVSTILVRTLMDRRYYYGIRVEAAMALPRCATADLEWCGQFHLMKAFQEFFCFPDTSSKKESIPRSNDFGDFTAYYVQKAIPLAMSEIRNLSGECPSTAQRWLLDILRYNDNSNNLYEDHFYVATLMTALAKTLISAPKPQNDFDFNMEFEDADALKTKEEAMKELERQQRMDQWKPSFRNVISQHALDIRKMFVECGVSQSDLTIFLPYVKDGTLDTLRVKAIDCLVDLGGLKNPAILRLVCGIMSYDKSPYIRRRAQVAFGRGLGLLATEEKAIKSEPNDGNFMMMDDHSVNDNARRDALARETIEGAVVALKKDLQGNLELKEALWDAIKSPELGLTELRYLLDICHLFYDTKNSMLVKIKREKHWVVRRTGKTTLCFRKEYRSLEPVQVPRPSLPPTPVPSAASAPSNSISTPSRPSIGPIRLSINNPRAKSGSATPNPYSRPASPAPTHSPSINGNSSYPPHQSRPSPAPHSQTPSSSSYNNHHYTNGDSSSHSSEHPHKKLKKSHHKDTASSKPHKQRAPTIPSIPGTPSGSGAMSPMPPPPTPTPPSQPEAGRSTPSNHNHHSQTPQPSPSQPRNRIILKIGKHHLQAASAAASPQSGQGSPQQGYVQSPSGNGGHGQQR